MSYRNPITYVDTESGKYYAQALQTIGNQTANVINKLGAKAEEERKKREEENKRLLQNTIKFNLDYQNSADLVAKDFDIQPALQPALSAMVDKGADIKARLFNAKSPSERAMLQKELAAYESFFKGGGMGNLLKNFQGMRESFAKGFTPGKGGSEGGIDMQKMDNNLSKFFLSTYNNNLPSDLGIDIVNKNGSFDIILNSKGGTFGDLSDDYQQSLGALMSSELPIIPSVTAENDAILQEQKLLDKNGFVSNKGLVAYLKAAGTKKLGDGRVFQTYELNDEGMQKFRRDMGKDVLSIIAGYSNQDDLQDSPASGFNQLESYYNNVLREKGDPELKIGNEDGTVLDKESLKIFKDKMVNRLEEQFKNGINPEQLVKPKTPPSSTSPKQAAIEIYNEIIRDPISAYNRYNQGPNEQATLIEGSIISVPKFDKDTGEPLDPVRYNMDRKQDRAIFFNEVLNQSDLVGKDDKGRKIRLEFPKIVDEMSDKYIKEKTKKFKKDQEKINAKDLINKYKKS